MAVVIDLSRQAVSAVEAIHAPGSSSSQREEAYKTCKNLLEHQAAFDVGLQLAGSSETTSMVKHFGLQLAHAGLKRNWNSLSGVEKESTKASVLRLMNSGFGNGYGQAMPSFLRWKLTRVMCEIARQDWPEGWPDLASLLFKGGLVSADSGVSSLFILSELADSVHDDAGASLTPRRRRELAAAIGGLMADQTAEQMSLFGFIEEVLRQHGADQGVVHGVLSLLRALPAAVPVERLLAYRCDFVIRTAIAGGNSELRAAALLALAEWLPRLYSPPLVGIRGSTSAIKAPALPDVCRLLALLTQLAGSCVFDRSQESLGLHRQVAELLADLCEHSAVHLCEHLPAAELASLWRTLLNMARYPSMHIQHEVLTGISHLAKAHPAHQEVIPYTEIFNIFFVLLLRLDRLPNELPPSRSAWLLQCLGPAMVDAQAVPINNFGSWCASIAEAWVLEIGGDQEARHRMFGNLKARILDSIKSLCRIAPDASGLASYACFATLCRQTASLAQRARFEGDEVAFDAALGLAERVAPSIVQEAAESVRSSVLEASLSLLQQSAGEQQPGTSGLEQRLLEFLAHMSPLYRHLPAEVSSSVLQRVLAVLRQPREGATKEVRQQAQSALVAIGRSGALREGQIDAIASECQSLASHLSVPEQASVAESIVAAVAAAGIAPARQAAIAETFMQGPTDLWSKAGLAQLGAHAVAEWLCARLGNAAACRQGQHVAALHEVIDLRNLLIAFAGVTSRCSLALGRSGSSGSSGAVSTEADAKLATDAAVAGETGAAPHPASRIVAIWAPGVLSLAEGLNALPKHDAAAPGQTLAAVLCGLADNELHHILGQRPGQDEVSSVPPDLDREAIRASRQRLWELRLASAKALQTCVLVPEFWSQVDAVNRVRALAASLSTQRPHVAQLLLSHAFTPLFQGPPSLAALGGRLHKEMLPAVLSAAVGTVEVNWRMLSQPQTQLGSLEWPLATASVTLARFVATFIAGLLGPGSPHQLDALEISRPSFKPPSAPTQAGQRKSKRSRNRFAALAEADTDGAAASNGHESGTPHAAQTKGHDASRVSGHMAMIAEDPASREAVCSALAALTQYPDVEVVRKVLQSLGLMAAHLFNLAAGSSNNPGTLLHQLGCALSPLPLSVLRPVLHLVIKPPSLTAAVGGERQDGELRVLASIVSPAWASFLAKQQLPSGKSAATELVAEAGNTALAALRPLAKLLRLQCQQLGWTCASDQIHRCAPLLESVQLLRRLPGAAEAEVIAVVEALLDEADDLDAGRVAVRALLRRTAETNSTAAEAPSGLTATTPGGGFLDELDEL